MPKRFELIGGQAYEMYARSIEKGIYIPYFVTVIGEIPVRAPLYHDEVYNADTDEYDEGPLKGYEISISIRVAFSCGEQRLYEDVDYPFAMNCPFSNVTTDNGLYMGQCTYYHFTSAVKNQYRREEEPLRYLRDYIVKLDIVDFKKYKLDPLDYGKALQLADLAGYLGRKIDLDNRPGYTYEDLEGVVHKEFDF